MNLYEIRGGGTRVFALATDMQSAITQWKSTVAREGDAGTSPSDVGEPEMVRLPAQTDKVFGEHKQALTIDCRSCLQVARYGVDRLLDAAQASPGLVGAISDARINLQHLSDDLQVLQRVVTELIATEEDVCPLS